MKEPLRISGYLFTHFDVLVVELADQGVLGRGEASGVYYHGESPQRMAEQIERARARLESGISRTALREVLPPGGARAAVDAALWDLEAKRTGISVYERAHAGVPRALPTTYTIGAHSPERMARAARSFAGAPRLKLKLTGEDDLERLRAVRAACPQTWVGIDANQGLTRASLEALLPDLEALRVQLIEQPLPVGQEMQLRGLRSPIPLAADESVQTMSDLRAALGIFDVINIKLDKCGGLTEALLMVHEIRRLGMSPMVGCMSSTTLGIAPACVIGQLCDLVDLDAPMFLREDRSPASVYRDGMVCCPQAWGFPDGHRSPMRAPDTEVSGEPGPSV
jgi:L-alanine-DL-glutamate epimerase-like enolase superfamily enzyme